MEKFIMADGCAVRINDTGTPRGTKDGGTARESNDAGSTRGSSDVRSVQESEDAGTARESRDGEMAAREYKTIVLLHGYLGSIESWEDFMPLLKTRARVIAIDLPGHGISEVKGEIHTMEFLADTVHAALNVLGVSKCVVCGHSMGGYAALEMLRKYPETLEGIILLHSTPMADTPDKRENRDREIAVVSAGKKELLTINASAVFAPQNRKRFSGHIEGAADRIYLTDDDGITALLRGMKERRNNNDTLSMSTVPQMFIFGRHDEYIPATVAEEVIKLHPEARIEWLENSGHMSPVEEPKTTAEMILSFVDSIA